MKLSLIIIAFVITVGFFLVSSGLGQGSMLYTFLASFGLFMVIIVVGVMLAAKKQKDDDQT
ncbi:hypothetical protein [Aliiglaciecola litoralis]|uniref:Uncharacterized protein n=1 Tax=Aliiglaciecola litoralis TaxID=582857 RepID=A0ABP3WRX9_9ALTE